MPDLIHSLTARLRHYVGDRRRTLRREARLEAHLPFSISLLNSEKDAPESLPPALSLSGQTRDLSERGLTLLLPAVRIRNVYLTDRDHYLGISLELPSGSIGIMTTSVRFEQLPTKEAGYSYLLGVRILRMEEGAQDHYTAYLSSLQSRERRVERGGQIRAARTVVAGQGGRAPISSWESLTPQAVNRSFEKFLRERK